jgi:hypothetical protein
MFALLKNKKYSALTTASQSKITVKGTLILGLWRPQIQYLHLKNEKGFQI